MVDISQKGATLRFTLEEFDLQAIANLGGPVPRPAAVHAGAGQGPADPEVETGGGPPAGGAAAGGKVYRFVAAFII